MGRNVTTELPNLVPLRHIDDLLRDSSFTEKFVICSYQVTKTFRSGHECTSTSSARSPRYFCVQADIAIRVLRQVLVDTMLTRTRFHFCSRLRVVIHEKSWEYLDPYAQGFPTALKDYFHRLKISRNSCSQSGKTCNRTLCTSSCPSFFVFGFYWFMQRDSP